jgi:hypothetical protein
VCLDAIIKRLNFIPELKTTAITRLHVFVFQQKANYRVMADLLRPNELCSYCSPDSGKIEWNTMRKNENMAEWIVE